MVNLRDRDQKEIQKKLQAEMARQGFDGLLLTDFGAVYYATGYASKFQYLAGVPGTTMAVVPAEGECILILSEFEMQSPKVYCKDIQIETLNSPVFIDELDTMVTSKPVKADSNAGFLRALEIIRSRKADAKIGIQMNYMTVGPMKYLQEHAGEAQLADCGDLLNRVRAIKTKWEISVLREAAQMSEATLYDVMKNEFKVGMTQAEYLNLMHRRSFEKSVYITDYIDMNAFGTHFSPAYLGIDIPSKEGDIIRYDGGVTYMGYLTDFARTFCIGKPSDRAKQIYAAEAAGYETVMSMAAPESRWQMYLKKRRKQYGKTGFPTISEGLWDIPSDAMFLRKNGRMWRPALKKYLNRGWCCLSNFRTIIQIWADLTSRIRSLLQRRGMRNLQTARARSLRFRRQDKVKYDFDKKIERIGTSCSKWDSEESYRTGEVIPMWVADMDFPVPEPVMKSIRRRAEHPVMGYVFRDRSFAEITAEWMKKRHAWEIGPEWVTFCPGIVPALSAAVQAFTMPGETVMLQSPVYYPFSNTILACGRKVTDNPVRLQNGRYTMDLEDMEEKIKKEHVKLLLFCNPHNPVGRVYTEEELREMGDICLRNNVRIFSDEIHSDLVFTGHKHIPLASLSAELSRITMTGIAPSKTFNLAGLQTAAVICEDAGMKREFERIITMNSIHFCNVFGLEAYKAAYMEGEEYLEQLLGYLEKNLSYCGEFFEKYLSPLRFTELEGTYLLWIDCRDLKMDREQLDRFMTDKARIALDSGYWFGPSGEGFMRMNIACPMDTLKQALGQLEEAVRSWRSQSKGEDR